MSFGSRPPGEFTDGRSAQTRRHLYPRPLVARVDRQKIISILLVLLMVGSSFAYAVTLL